MKRVIDASNRIYPDITSLDYGLAGALEAHFSSYDYIISQPIVLNHETGARWIEIVEGPVPCEDRAYRGTQRPSPSSVEA